MHITRRAVVGGAMGLALVLGGTSCGKVAEKAAEKASEKAIESTSECEDVDLSDGGASVTCDGDTYDYSGEGSASLPEGWPSDVALPDGAAIVAASSTQDPPAHQATGTVDGELGEVYEEAEGLLTDAGYEIEGSSQPSGEVQVGSIQARGSGLEVNVSLYGDGSGSVTVVYTISESLG